MRGLRCPTSWLRAKTFELRSKRRIISRRNDFDTTRCSPKHERRRQSPEARRARRLGERARSECGRPPSVQTDSRGKGLLARRGSARAIAVAPAPVAMGQLAAGARSAVEATAAERPVRAAPRCLRRCLSRMRRADRARRCLFERRWLRPRGLRPAWRAALTRQAGRPETVDGALAQTACLRTTFGRGGGGPFGLAWVCLAMGRFAPPAPAFAAGGATSGSPPAGAGGAAAGVGAAAAAAASSLSLQQFLYRFPEPQ